MRPVGKSGARKKTLVEKDQVRGRLNKLDIHKSIGPDVLHPQVLKDLADVFVRILLVIFERPD